MNNSPIPANAACPKNCQECDADAFQTWSDSMVYRCDSTFSLREGFVQSDRCKISEQSQVIARLKAALEEKNIAAWRNQPRIVCLCGSTRFMEAFQEANLRETLAGRIVLSVGCNTKSDAGLGITDEVKQRLDVLHKQKIDLADEVLVLNVGGYIGNSTRSEIEHAERTGKPIRYLEPTP